MPLCVCACVLYFFLLESIANVLGNSDAVDQIFISLKPSHCHPLVVLDDILFVALIFCFRSCHLYFGLVFYILLGNILGFCDKVGVLNSA